MMLSADQPGAFAADQCCRPAAAADLRLVEEWLAGGLLQGHHG